MQSAFTKQVVVEGDDAELLAILEEVCQRTSMGFAAIARVTDSRWVASQVVDKIEFGLQPGDELDLKTTICDDIRQCGERVVIDHVAANLQWRTHPTPMLYGFESYVSLPLFLDDGSFYGTLCAIDPDPRPLSAADTIAALERLAHRVAAIVQRRRSEAPES